MTVQEAIAQIEPIAKSSRKVSGVGLFEPKPITIALEMAISALGKQIPKEPVKTQSEIVCPTCRTLVDSSPYCRYCGQAIVWGEKK